MKETPLSRLRGSLGKSGFRVLGLGAALALGIGIVAMGTAMEVSSRPNFCGSCHIMTPYYESWKQSSHKGIACVDCHIPPGVTAELRKKYEALSMVARYFTGTYGTNPWTEIDDAACLKCHERRLLAGKELFGDVLFDHSAHLAGMRRGKTLRCTSCHSQIVQGSHIAVTATTCILCHFKGQASGTGTARCTLCHQVPDKVIQQGNLTFNHADVGRYGMDCTWCHVRPEGSDGAVPKERCVTCHNEPSRLQAYQDTDLLHRMHVTEHKVDCLHCHLEIQHVGQPRIEAAATSCSTCHEQGHSPQMTLYTGVGGRGVEAMPNPMFLAGVRCEGCHLQIPGHDTGVRRASEISCMSCHGPSYRKVFLEWKATVTERTAAVERQYAQTVAAIPGPMPAPLQDARFNLDLVTRGHGIHNVDYAYALLRRSHDDLNAARAERRLAPLPSPWAEIPYKSPCLACHQGIEGQQGRIFDREFQHRPHVMKAKLECSACHRTHEEREKGEVVRYDASGCVSCHHADTRGGVGCLGCHAGIRQKTVKVPRGDFSHAFHLDEAGQTCVDCHEVSPGKEPRLKEETCAGCHG
jgi:nitrate/TMAO reductase-like tetraheme cytochrome c subunit